MSVKLGQMDGSLFLTISSGGSSKDGSSQKSMSVK